MTKTDLGVVNDALHLNNWFLDGINRVNGSGQPVTITEGSIVYDSPGIWKPILRADSIPFGGLLNGNNMDMRFGISDGIIARSPKLGAIGSSSMAGYAQTTGQTMADQFNAWFTAHATTPNAIVNLAVGGYTMANLRTVANGGTAGQNCEAIYAQKPTVVYVDEPTNWAGAYDEATQISYMLELVTFFNSRGIPVFFSGPRPRTAYGTGSTAQVRLANLVTLIAAHPVLKFIVNNNFSHFVKGGTQADINPAYDSGDGVHMNDAGIAVHMTDVLNFMANKFAVSVTAFDQYIIEKSINGGTSYTVMDTVTDMTINKKSYPAADGLYRSRARLKVNQTYTDYSATSQVTLQNPSASAGNNQNVTASTATLAGTGTAYNGATITAYLWTQTGGPNTATMATPNAASCALSGLVTGTYMFQLQVTDSNGKTGVASTTVGVNVATASRRFLGDWGGDTNTYGGAGLKTPDNNAGATGQDTLTPAKTWNNATNFISGTGTYPLTIHDGMNDTANQALAGLKVLFQKSTGGTYDGVHSPVNTGGNPTQAFDYPASAVQDSVYLHTTAGTIPIDIVVPSGLTFTKMTVKTFGNRMNTADDRTSMFKWSDDPTDIQAVPVAQQYNAAGTAAGNLTKQAILPDRTITSAGGTFTLQWALKAGCTWGHLGVIDIIFS